MSMPSVSAMTLRQKIGQTGMPAPNTVAAGVKRCGGYKAYFEAFPFTGLYCAEKMMHADGTVISSADELRNILGECQKTLPLPLLVSCDAELGARYFFEGFHRIPSMMSVGAANSPELAYWRSYYWARELRMCGINWPFGPVGDLLGNFFSVSGVRCMSDEPEIPEKLLPSVIRGIQDAGCAATAKHFPSGGRDYRDSHFCSNRITTPLERWRGRSGRVWQAAVNADCASFMLGHSSFPGADPGFARGSIPRPATASKKVMDILRKDMGFRGVAVTDAVSMKALAAAFEHEDVYIECFNAGNDVILFCHDDYIDIMERAVLDGRVSMERLDEAVGRVLALKQRLELFGDIPEPQPLSGAERAHFHRVCYDIGKKAITLLNNRHNALPFDPQKVHRAAVIVLAPYAPFLEDLQVALDALERRGIQVTVVNALSSKAQLEDLANSNDMIIYACFLAQSRPLGMSFYSRQEDLNTLFNGLSYGAEKSITVSFGAPSIYYNYFEEADIYLNAYSSDPGTMEAFADGILGDFPFTGKSPVKLRPEFRDL